MILLDQVLERIEAIIELQNFKDKITKETSTNIDKYNKDVNLIKKIIDELSQESPK